MQTQESLLRVKNLCCSSIVVQYLLLARAILDVEKRRCESCVVSRLVSSRLFSCLHNRHGTVVTDGSWPSAWAHWPVPIAKVAIHAVQRSSRTPWANPFALETRLLIQALLHVRENLGVRALDGRCVGLTVSVLCLQGSGIYTVRLHYTNHARRLSKLTALRRTQLPSIDTILRNQLNAEVRILYMHYVIRECLFI